VGGVDPGRDTAGRHERDAAERERPTAGVENHIFMSFTQHLWPESIAASGRAQSPQWVRWEPSVPTGAGFTLR
jgi:hypothetical protein